MRLGMWLTGTDGSSMVESAFTIPILILLAVALVNLSLAGFASVTASGAADYGARIGAVDQVNPVGAAVSAASRMLSVGVGRYRVSASGSASPGGYVTVRVRWEVPNMFSGLLSFFGGHASGTIHGEAVSTQRKEGW